MTATPHQPALDPLRPLPGVLAYGHEDYELQTSSVIDDTAINVS